MLVTFAFLDFEKKSYESNRVTFHNILIDQGGYSGKKRFFRVFLVC